jgi:hypothetical protein
MIKKNISIACTIASLILILDSIGIWNMFMMFLFAGIIPGTNIALTPTQMLVLIIILTSIVITKTGVLPLLRKFNLINTKQNKLTIRRLSRV